MVQEGDTRFYKHPNKWGSPIERAKVIQVHGPRACTVEVGEGEDTRTVIVPTYLLEEFAQDADEKAKRWEPEVSHVADVYAEHNERMIARHDFDFKMKCPVVMDESSPTRYVVCEDVSSSMVLTDSWEAAVAARAWLRKATGQRCKIRTVQTHTLSMEKPAAEQQAEKPASNIIHADAKDRAILSLLVNPNLRRLYRSFSKADIYGEARGIAARRPSLWGSITEQHGCSPDLEVQITKCQQEDENESNDGSWGIRDHGS